MYAKWEKFADLPRPIHLVLGLALILGPRLFFKYSVWTIAAMLLVLLGALYARWLARILLRFKVTPNQITIVGCLFATAGFWPLVMGRLELGFVLIIVSVALDVQDGLMARISGLSSQRGGFLDSVLDRVADGFVFSGLSLYFAGQGKLLWAGLSLAALMGALMVSYTRAKAERYLEICDIGFLGERPDRFFILIPLAIIGYPEIGIAAVIVTTWLTVIRRIHYSWNALDPNGPGRAYFQKDKKPA